MLGLIMKIISRKEAKDKGLKRYFTGNPCKYGHTVERMVCDCKCMECSRLSCRDKYRLDPSYYNNANSEWYKRNKELRSEYNKQWRSKNKEYFRDHNKQWTAKNREHIRRYKENNKEKLRQYKRNRRARECGADGYNTYEDIRYLEFLQKMRCAGCLINISCGYEVDHIMPLVSGGSNWPDNLQLLCTPCNRHKSSKHPDDWTPDYKTQNR